MKIEEVYKYVLRILGAWAIFFFLLEALTGKLPGVGILDSLAGVLCPYLAYTLRKRGSLSTLDQGLSLVPPLFLFRHLFFISYGENSGAGPYLFYVLLSALGGFIGYKWLERLKPKDQALKPKNEEVGDYPIYLDEEKKHCITTRWSFEHIQVIGKSGSGKSASYFLNAKYQSIHQGKGSFNFDAKSEELPHIAYYADHAGRLSSLKVLDLRSPERSADYNPFYKFRKEPDGTTVPDSEAVSNIICGSMFFHTEGEPYYRDLGKNFLKNFTNLFHREFSVITYADYYTAIVEEITTFKSIEALCNKYPGTPEAHFFRNQWLIKSLTEREKTLSGLVNRLSRFVTTRWAPLVNSKTPKIVMADVVEKRQIFHFGAAALNNSEDYKPLLIAILYDIQSEVQKRYNNETVTPFDVFLDEFYNVIYDDFINFINKCRSARIPVHLGHQSMGDLKRISEHFADEIGSSTNSKIIFRVNTATTADEFSKLIGTKMADPKYVRSLKTNAGAFGGRQEAGVTEKIEEEFIITPNRIKRLNKGEAAVYLAYDQGVTQDIIQFPLAPKPPSDFNLSTVVPQNDNYKRPVEKSLPFAEKPFGTVTGGGDEKPIQKFTDDKAIEALKAEEREMKLKRTQKRLANPKETPENERT